MATVVATMDHMLQDEVSHRSDFRQFAGDDCIDSFAGSRWAGQSNSNVSMRQASALILNDTNNIATVATPHQCSFKYAMSFSRRAWNTRTTMSGLSAAVCPGCRHDKISIQHGLQVRVMI